MTTHKYTTHTLSESYLLKMSHIYSSLILIRFAHCMIFLYVRYIFSVYFFSFSSTCIGVSFISSCFLIFHVRAKYMSFYVGYGWILGCTSLSTRTTLCINDEANCEKEEKRTHRKNSFSHIDKFLKINEKKNRHMMSKK